jgi:xanthine dehydrogenase molybdopterin binding subunit/xanthine dehydrogenase small subunit
MDKALAFTLNGRAVSVSDVSTQRTLLDWLRSQGHTGTKEGCAEGDCGACTVAVVDTNTQGKRVWRAINACITLLPMVAGREVMTVEGIAEDAPHPVQEAMANGYGSQCGYCTPGFVMSMFEAYYREDIRDRADIADQLCGNLCRCTGYRPIRDATLEAIANKNKAVSDRFRLPVLPPENRTAIDYTRDNERFLAPRTLAELCALKDVHPDAVLIAGATEIGVDINKKFKNFPLLISTDNVDQLRTVQATETHWTVGGAATLTAMEEAMAGELHGLHKMLRVFASRQIRNRATLAGNLATASPIGDLPPVMLALDAEIVLQSVNGVRTVAVSDFFLGYRTTVLQRNEIIVSVRFARAPAQGLTRRFQTYKVSKRRELDISIVAAAFVIDTDADNIVRHARLAYGGVAATPVRAQNTEKFLTGKPWNLTTVQHALETLSKEFTPIADVRSGVDFRKGLIGSLFEKFFDGVETLGQDQALDFYDSPTHSPGDSSRALVHESAMLHATGAAKYVDDQCATRAMLELWPVCSPHAHARIVRKDAARARTMPGVAAVLFAEDIPGTNDVGAVRHDETLLAQGEVLFHGHIVAIVAAETYDQARRAAEAVVVEYEPLAAIVGLDAAIAADSFHTAGHRIRRGDCSAALTTSPHTLEGSLTIGGQEHFYLESQAAWAELNDDGSVHVSSSTQHPSEIQAVVSHVLHVPRNQVVVEAPRMGGGFGGKETQGNTWAALVALVALKTRRPARVMLDRDLDMALTGKRHPFLANFKVGFDGEGRVLALKADLVSDGGWALDLSESICDRALFHIDNSYYLPNVDVFGRVAKTHVVSHTAFRGFGGPQGMVVIEEVLDRVARALNLATETVRERNLYHGDGETSTTHYGQYIEDNRIETIWKTLKETSEFEKRRAEIRGWNAVNSRVKRGMAITPVKFGISFTATFLNQAGAYVLVYRDGSVQVNHGGTEMGQGLHTKVQGIAVRELGIAASRVRVMKTQTDKVPNTSATAASAGADLNGAAVRDACVTLRNRMMAVAAEMLSCDVTQITYENSSFTAPNGRTESWESVCEGAYFRQVQLAATGYYRTPGIGYDKSIGKGKPFHYFAFGAAVVEVEVDGYSGMKRIVRTDILHDVGDSLNPGIDRGQIEGAFVQGLGWLTAEELSWNTRGVLSTHSASTYQIPAVSDAPMDFRVALLPDAAQRNTIHGSKAVGEPPLMLAIAAREAIRDAIAAFGKHGGQIALASPATHEAIYHAIAARTGSVSNSA